MKIFIKAAILAAVAFVWIWGAVVEPYYFLDRERLTLSLDRWNPKLDGLKVVLISDVHAGYGPHENWRVKRIVAAANAEKPDVILLLGDYVNGGIYYHKMSMDRMSAYFRGLKAKYGVYAILGNHDTIYNVGKIRKMLGDANAVLLENSNRKVSTPNGDFYIAGIADPITQSYYYKPTFAGIPKGASVMFLAHAPDVFREIPLAASVTFSGHTHGGQIRMPYFGEFTSNLKYDAVVSGILEKDSKTIYVSRGLGTSRIPMRLFCRPEISVITLRAKNPAPAAQKTE